MKIGIIGSGQVAQTLGSRLLDLGHSVMISSRNPEKEKDRGSWGKIPSANSWVKSQKNHKAKVGSFSQAASFGEFLINCTAGVASIQALSSCEDKSLRGKILVDLANPLDFSKGMPPTLTICNTESLGERIQKTFPSLKVVKALNTVSAPIMVNPSLVGDGNHDLLICGNDPDAKKWVKEVLLARLGWNSVIDLGDISSARGTEMYLPLWLRLFQSFQTPNFNIKIVK